MPGADPAVGDAGGGLLGRKPGAYEAVAATWSGSRHELFEMMSSPNTLECVGRRSGFAAGDRPDLREQFRDPRAPRRLTTRENLYSKHRTAPVAWFPWLVRHINWPPDGEVLEVGCGTGSLWVEAADHLPDGLSLTLTDLFAGMVSVARDRVQREAKYAMVRAEQSDPIELPFDDRFFDVVVANHMLYHTNPTRAVPELARVLRDDGVLVASTNGPRDYAIELSELSAEVFGGLSASETLEVFSSVTGPPIVSGSFARVERRDYHDDLRCTEPDEVVAWITSGPPAQYAAPTQLEQLRSAVQERFDASGGVWKLTREVCVFLCREPHRAPLSTH